MNDTRRTERLKLRLYIIGSSPHTEAARNNLRRLLDHELRGAKAEIVNILDEPELAYADKITTAPVLVRLEPRPRLMLLGDLSDTDTVVRELVSGVG